MLAWRLSHPFLSLFDWHHILIKSIFDLNDIIERRDVGRLHWFTRAWECTNVMANLVLLRSTDLAQIIIITVDRYRAVSWQPHFVGYNVRVGSAIFYRTITRGLDIMRLVSRARANDEWLNSYSSYASKMWSIVSRYHLYSPSATRQYFHK